MRMSIGHRQNNAVFEVLHLGKFVHAYLKIWQDIYQDSSQFVREMFFPF